jgi:putative restriction endonuclease
MRAHVSFGLSQELADHFLLHPKDAWLAAHHIAVSIVPNTLREELVSATLGAAASDPLETHSRSQPVLLVREVAPSSRIVRDPRFGARVLRAYGERCVVCEIAPRLRDRLFGLEAAHIRWAAAEGPDEVWNGLCLCRMHHAGFDRGAFTLDEKLRVRVARELAREARTKALFHAFDRHTIRSPADASHSPDPDMLRWHQREVFRDHAVLVS